MEPNNTIENRLQKENKRWRKIREQQLVDKIEKLKPTSHDNNDVDRRLQLFETIQRIDVTPAMLNNLAEQQFEIRLLRRNELLVPMIPKTKSDWVNILRETRYNFQIEMFDTQKSIGRLEQTLKELADSDLKLDNDIQNQQTAINDEIDDLHKARAITETEMQKRMRLEAELIRKNRHYNVLANTDDI